MAHTVRVGTAARAAVPTATPAQLDEEKEFGGLSAPTPPRATLEEQRAKEETEFGGVSTVSESRFLTPEQRAGAFGKRAAGSLLQTGGFTAGAIKGAQIGGRRGLIGAAAGAIIGGVSGFLAGDVLANAGESVNLTVSSIEDLPPKQRPYGAAGEVVGGSIPFMAAPILASRAGVVINSGGMAGRYLNRIIESAGKAPAAFLSFEIGATSSAAVASGVAELAAPGNLAVRIPAEIVAGFSNPVGRTVDLGRTVFRRVRQAVMRMSPDGQLTRGGQIFNESFRTAKDDPEAFMNMLREAPDVTVAEGVPLTVAQITANRTIKELTKDLRSINPKFDADMARQAEDAIESTNRSIALLRSTGDPEAIKVAAELRSDIFRYRMQRKLDEGELRVQQAVDALEGNSPVTRAQASKAATEILEETLDRARAVERDLWGVPDGKIELGASGIETTVRRFSKLKGELLEREKFPTIVEETIADFKDAKAVLKRQLAGEKVTKAEIALANKRLSVGTLLTFRSRMLSLSRKAAAAQDADEARIFGELADAALSDLERLAGTEVGTAIDEARRWSRALNDVFTRTFVGKAARVGKQGNELMPPEVLLRRALASGKEMGDIQMGQLEEATRFLADRGLGTPLDARSIDGMWKAQERIIRLTAAMAVKRDPATQVVTGIDTAKLRAFMNDNADLLNRFPESRALMEDAIQSQAGREAMMAQVTRATKFSKEKAIIAEVLGVESAMDAVRGVLKSKFPIARFRALANLAKKSGLQAQDGLKAAVLEDAFRSATNPNGTTNLVHLVSALDDPIRPGLPSVTELMRQEGLLTPTQGRLLNQLIDRARRIAEAEASRAAGNPPTEATDAVIDAIFSGIGSTAGVGVLNRVRAMFGFTGGTQSLIVAGRSASAARRLLGKAPALKVQQLLIRALNGEPIRPGAARNSLLLTMMKKGQIPAEAEIGLRQIHAYGIQTGLLSVGSYEIEGERQ